MSILRTAKDFTGLHGLTYSELDKLSCEIREMILKVTLKNGGHLASSLGAVELTVALLRAFDPDSDKIIFDVGHQSYAYKILTKRLDQFETLRTKGGIAGFPRMDESPYDFFTTGHSSTSISAALGYAKARDLKGESHDVVALIGDGALLNGLALEAQAGRLQALVDAGQEGFGQGVQGLGWQLFGAQFYQEILSTHCAASSLANTSSRRSGVAIGKPSLARASR